MTEDLARPDVPAPVAVVRDFVNTTDHETGVDDLTTPAALVDYLRVEGLLGTRPAPRRPTSRWPCACAPGSGRRSSSTTQERRAPCPTSRARSGSCRSPWRGRATASGWSGLRAVSPGPSLRSGWRPTT